MGSVFDLFWILIAVIGSSAFGILGIALLIKYGSAMFTVLVRKQGAADQVIAPEPAFKQYFFHKAWTDYKSIVELGTKASWDLLDGVIQLSYRTERYFFPAANMMVIGSAAGVVTGGALLAVVGLFHLSMVIAVCVVAMTLAYLCRVLEYGSMLWRKIFMVCPHAGCYRRIALPIYYCPSCSAQHKQLIPGSYGTFRRRCQCGQLLPTLFLLGRNRLPSICPHEHCGRPLSTATGVARNLHIPLVGGPTAGKSSLLSAMMFELSQKAQTGQLKLEFPEKKDERLFAVCREAFENGQTVAKTAAYSPTAFMAAIEDGRGKSALVYAYDAAGELYQGAPELQGQEYYSYTHGIVLVIDPYSMPDVQKAQGSEYKSVQHAIRPSSELTESVYGRMVESLRGFSQTTGRIDQPLAVVVTKTDALGLRQQIQSESRGGEASELSDAVKQWLVKHGEGNLVRTIERDFKDVRYFACSALGRIPGQEPAGAATDLDAELGIARRPRPFKPVDVLHPLAWLLGRYGLRIEGDKAAGQAPRAS